MASTPEREKCSILDHRSSPHKWRARSTSPSPQLTAKSGVWNAGLAYRRVRANLGLRNTTKPSAIYLSPAEQLPI